MELAADRGRGGVVIGCGALVVRAAKLYGAIATGITLSENQLAHARERIRAEGLRDRCTVELRDYMYRGS